MEPPDAPGQTETSLASGYEEGREQSRREPGPLMRPIREGEQGIEDQRKIASHALKIWESMDKVLERPEAQWKVNAARRLGITNAKLRRISSIDESHWTAWLPKNASPDLTPDINRAAMLCRRLVSMLFADPPVAEIVPPSTEDEDIAAAEFSGRVLEDLQGETGLNSATRARESEDKACTFASAYERFWIDQTGGGQAPREIQARRDATHEEVALIDPKTGLESPPYETRYVRPDGTLTDHEVEAELEWIPGIKSEILDGRNVRLIPHTVSDIWEADGAQIVSFKTWGELKRMAPDLAKLPAEDKKAIMSERPQNADDMIPGGKFADVEQPENEDQRLCFTLTTYMKQSHEYPEGVYLICLAKRWVLHRSKWMDNNEGRARPLDIPITQYSQFKEGRDGYWRVSLMELIGGGNELRAAQISHLLDHLERLNNRKMFLPTNSILTAEEVAAQPNRQVFAINPGGEPKFEEIPRWPSDSYSFTELVTRDMDDASGIQESARGTQDPNVKSGRHAFAIISQVHAGLSEIRDNAVRGYLRGSRITLQLARAFFDTPRELKWNEDGRYRHRAWDRSDLTTSTDIRLKAGTMTMLAPAAKAQLAEHYAQLGVLPPDEMREILGSSIGGTIGLQDNPFRLRVRNQLSEWGEGPPDGWLEARRQTLEALLAQNQGQPPVDPSTGQPLPPPPDPLLTQIFEPIPCDTLPNVAPIRIEEIAKYMAGRGYLRHPPQWRLGLDMEYQRMIAATQPPPGAVPPPGGGSGAQPETPSPGGPEPGPERDLVRDALREGAPPELVSQGL